MQKYSCERYLYHYTKTQTLLDHILPENRLLLNFLSKSNDPREYKYRLFDLKSHSLFSENELVSVEDAANNVLSGHSRMTAFVCDTNWAGQTPEYRGYMHPRMWAQYSENHKGVCLILDRTKLITSFQEHGNRGSLYWGEVSYVDRAPRTAKVLDYETIQIGDAINASIFSHVTKYARELFFRKNVDWRDEAEYRFLMVQREIDGLPLYVDIGTALNGVVVGSEFEEARLKPLIEFAETTGFCVGLMQWKDGNGYIGSTPYPAINSEGHYSEQAYHFGNVDFYTRIR
jgi:Protein of unknown function (DUF2971)